MSKTTGTTTLRLNRLSTWESDLSTNLKSFLRLMQGGRRGCNVVALEQFSCMAIAAPGCGFGRLLHSGCLCGGSTFPCVWPPVAGHHAARGLQVPANAAANAAGLLLSAEGRNHDILLQRSSSGCACPTIGLTLRSTSPLVERR